MKNIFNWMCILDLGNISYLNVEELLNIEVTEILF